MHAAEFELLKELVEQSRAQTELLLMMAKKAAPEKFPTEEGAK